ncbi:LysR family transcriptional regulator [Alicyclobacillus sp. SO9]|uniref:LysR family transcriptional regulator n=1 Tax=Alicyclobacillus sp. SO9 TaxID=2665646 RepID=UPI0018E85DD9|nr:LysR family transcriptional regulator [Alicyclobacillus sp. SO9]QQE77075.1 LysR family transcriptional regulator [Alicyclobacillus sp. SO9]
MELIDLRVFIEVSRSGSMSQAAAALHMGQPAVSQHVRALESTVGQQLFIRQHRGVALTDAGEEFRGFAERALAVLEEGLSSVQNMENQRLHIRVAAPPSVNSYFLMPFIQRMESLGYNITSLDEHSHNVIQHVYDGTVDAGFVLNKSSFPGIEFMDVWTDPLVCVLSPKHRLANMAHQASAEVSDLKGEQMVWFDYSSSASTFREEVEQILGDDYQWIETAPADIVKKLVKANLGVSFVPFLTVQHELECGELVQLPFENLPQEAWKISLVYRRRKRTSEALQIIQSVTRDLWPVR